MKSRIFVHISVLIILPFNLLFAQTTLQGCTYDEQTEYALYGTQLVLKTQELGCISDAKGHFAFENVSLDDTLMISYIGYDSKTIILSNKELGDLNIFLSPKNIEMNTLVVTGTKTKRYLKDVSIATRVLQKEQLTVLGAEDASQILGQVSGLNVVDNQFGTGIEINGLGDDHVLLMVDGLKVIGRMNGQLDISQIPIESIERVEIVKGASSALYGSEALGGVINIITKDTEQKFNLNANLAVGSFNKFHYGAGLQGKLGKLKIRASYNRRSQDSYRLTETIWEDGENYSKSDFNLKSSYQISKNQSFSLISHYFDEDQNFIANSVFSEVTGNTRLSNKVQWQMKVAKRGNFSLSIESSDYLHVFDQVVTQSGFLKGHSESGMSLRKGDAGFSKQWSKSSINLGGGIELESMTSDRISDGLRESTLDFAYAQLEHDFNTNWNLFSGVRLDYHSIYGANISPKLGLMFKPEPISRIRFSYGEGFRAPSFKELYIDFTELSINLKVFGNENLEPEASKNVTFDMERWHLNEYHGHLSAYFNKITNLIDYAYEYTDENDFVVYRSHNINEAIVTGFSVDFSRYHNHYLESSFNYSYLNSWDKDTEASLSLKASHQGQFTLTLKPTKLPHVSIITEYTGERFYWEDALEGEGGKQHWLYPYFLLHIGTNYTLNNKVSLLAGVRNVLDVYDLEWGPVPGREWYLTANYQLNPNKETK